MSPRETSTEEPAAEVVCTGVRRVFLGGVVAVGGATIRIEPGEFVAFLGPSGCGKSTLLRMIAGLDRPTSGRVEVGETDPCNRSVPIAFVFQDSHLLPWRTVLDNAALPLELLGVNKSERRAIAREVLRDVELADAADRIPAELSGGMKMRVSLARALVTKPRLLLLDEPFAALDELTRNRLDDRLRTLWRERGTTMIFVTHSITEAAYLAGRAIVFSKRPARIVSDRALDLGTDRTADLRGTAEFAAAVRTLQKDLEAADA
ncbi:MAG: ABC transporter ATP-binding protein [Polyangiaceae bacterium]|nr:ABC transporter ATP-binding protein [Polyangiaceae bacterium]